MKFTPVKTTGDQLTAEEYNETPSQELQNAVLSTGQSLNEADEFQLGQTMSVYGSAGDFYVDSGIVNAYILSPINIQQAPPAYTNGIRSRFVATTTNTGATTVNINGLGIKNIKENGANLIAGRIKSGDIIEISFLTASDDFDLVNFHTATLVSDVAATNGEVVSTVTFDDDGHVLTFTKRTLTASNGVILVGDDFQHADTSSVSDVTATGDEVISSITFDDGGHVLTFTKRSLSASDIGAEPAFSKNTAFNKNFGTTAGTVLEGDTVVGDSLQSAQLFSSSGTWIKPAGINKVIFHLIGGGGGGGSTASNFSGGGAGGEYAKGFIDVSAISSAPVVVGTGGAGAVAGGNTGTGGTTSSFLSNTAGAGNPGQIVNGGAPALLSAGPDIFLAVPGGGGDTGVSGNGGAPGGDTVFGGGARNASPAGPTLKRNGIIYGGGGSGSSNVTSSGGNGANGLVLIEEYT